nr:tail chaperone protein [Caudoviricetes sp.]CAI9750954.1 tail chaperone protein [Caudoviricetes sp.]
MQLTINDKDYTFKFGLRFVRELDKQITTNNEGIEFGVGTAFKLAQLVNAKDVAALSDVLLVANQTETPRIKAVDLDTFIEEHEDVEGLLNEVIAELETSNATASKVKTVREMAANN